MKTFKPTYEMIQAANTVLIAMAHTQTIKPIVNAYQQALIDKMGAPVSSEFKNRQDMGIITNPKHSYLMDDTDFRWYDFECKKAAKAAGLKVSKPDNCPLLEAEEVERIAKNYLIEVMQPIIKMTKDDLLCNKNGLENYAKVIDLTLRLLAPYCNKSEFIKDIIK